MKHLLLSAIACLAACNEHKINDAHNPVSDMVKTSSIVKSNDTMYYLWAIDFEARTRRKNSSFRQDWFNADTLITGLNQRYPNIKLEKVKFSGDTLYTAIKDAAYLGERMGTTGAAAYLADAIINLSSLEGVRYVKMDFEEGDHASPGTWTAADFNDFRQIQ